MSSDNLISSSELRKALGTFATGVTVVTTEAENGEPAGLTVNSFTSVSLSPPLILWCLASGSENLPIFQATDYFAINILASDQRHLSNHFARRQYNKFNGIAYHKGLGNSPLLDGCVTWIQCKTTKLYEAGDHWIIIGEIVDLNTTMKEGLIFNQSHYGVSLPLPAEGKGNDIPDELIYSDSNSYFSLLFQAIHSYQENFEKNQHEIIESDYEARMLVVLNHFQSATIDELCKVIQIPNNEIQALLQELVARGLIEINASSSSTTFKLTQTGNDKSIELLTLLQQHDENIDQLLGNEMCQQFKVNLHKIIDWDY